MQSKRPVVLITGGSRGIGASVAQLAAARGYDVAITYRSERDAAEEVLAACRAAGARAVACQGDVADEAFHIHFLLIASSREVDPASIVQALRGKLSHG